MGLAESTNLTSEEIIKNSYCKVDEDKRVKPRCLNPKEKAKSCNFHKKIKEDCSDCGSCQETDCVGPRKYLENLAAEAGLDTETSGYGFLCFKLIYPVDERTQERGKLCCKYRTPTLASI